MRHYTARLMRVLLLAVVCALACAATPPVGVPVAAEPPVPPTDIQESEAGLLGKRADQRRSAGDTEGARVLGDELLARYPTSLAAADELWRRGSDAEGAARLAEAIAHYEQLLLQRPTHPRGRDAQRRYGELLVAVERYADAAQVLRPLHDQAVGPERLQLASLLLRALRESNQAREALKVQVSLLADKSGDERRTAEQGALEIVERGLGLEEAQALWEDVRADPAWAFVAPTLGYRIAKLRYHKRDSVGARSMLETVVQRFPQSSFVGEARDLLRRIDAIAVVSADKVGVVLPLSGRFGQYGQRALKAIELAVGRAATLVVRDSEADPVVAARAVEELVLSEHVIAVIGELMSRPAVAAALKAEELGVPMLSLSHRAGLPEMGDYVFRTAVTVEAQAKALATWAFDELGYSQFAFLQPRNPYGQEFVDAFWDEVDRRKGEVRGIEIYEPDVTTFQVPARKIAGRYYVQARGEYHTKVAELRAQNLPSHRFQAALEKIQERLSPAIDFDALIIPDSAQNIGLLAPALAFEDVVLTHDPKLVRRIERATGHRNVKPITLMGGSTWNSMQTVERCEKHCEAALFVDGYYEGSAEPKIRDFAATFREAAGADPQLTEAIAFDTGGILKWALSGTPLADRDGLRRRLLELESFDGVTGRLRFEANGEIRRQLLRLTIKDATIQQWAPPEPEG